MKSNITIIILLLISTFFGSPTFTLAQAGSLDLSFDTNGIVTTSIGTGFNSAYSLAIQADDKILAAGMSYNNSHFNFTLIRYNANGSLDTTFNTDGIVITPIGPYDAYSYSVALQSDGKILLAGTSYDSAKNYFALVRYLSNGSLDTTFDTDGIVTTSFGINDDVGYAVAIQNDGRIVMTGFSYNGSTSDADFALARYNINGSLDSTFDTDGLVTTPIGYYHDVVYSIALQSDGKILVAGSAYNIFAHLDFALARYNSNGSLDSTFDTDGKVITDIGNSYDLGSSVAIQNDGKIVMAGYSENSNLSYDVSLARYNTDGSLDTTFDSDGKIILPIGFYEARGHSITIQSDGKILVAGSSIVSNQAFTLVRFNSNGSLDSTFSSDGVVTTLIGGLDDIGEAVAIQSNGKIIVAGRSIIGTKYDFSLARYNNTNPPFPIELVSFEAQCISGKVDLNWTVASQINNDYYTIERAADGVNFVIAGTVYSDANINQISNYSYTDTEPFLGKSYYRLKQTDIDGQFQYFQIVPVICNDFEDLIIYPNPSTGTVIINGAEQNSDIIFTDVLGQIIFRNKIDEEITEINISNFANGVYFITINANGFSTSKKIMINK